jgi:hypothetical protein
VSAGDVVMLIAGLACLAAAFAQWRRSSSTGLGTSAPMVAGALLVGGLCLVVGAVAG